MKPTLTINAGLRYDVQRPFYAQNNSYSTATLDDIFGVTGAGSGFQPGSVVNNLGNLFKPGVLTGQVPVFNSIAPGEAGYEINHKQFSPSVGLAWQMPKHEGPLGWLLGKNGSGPEGLPHSIIVTPEGVEGEVPVMAPNGAPAAEEPAAASAAPEAKTARKTKDKAKPKPRAGRKKKKR